MKICDYTRVLLVADILQVINKFFIFTKSTHSFFIFQIKIHIIHKKLVRRENNKEEIHSLVTLKIVSTI